MQLFTPLVFTTFLFHATCAPATYPHDADFGIVRHHEPVWSVVLAFLIQVADRMFVNKVLYAKNRILILEQDCSCLNVNVWMQCLLFRIVFGCGCLDATSVIQDCVDVCMQRVLFKIILVEHYSSHSLRLVFTHD